MGALWNLALANEYQQSIKQMEQRVAELNEQLSNKRLSSEARRKIRRRIYTMEKSLRDMTRVWDEPLHYYDKD